MKRYLTVIVAGGALILLVGAAKAHWGSANSTGGWGKMGPGMMGSGGYSYTRGGAGCPGWEATSTPQITEEKAQELAKHYTEKYLPDFKVEQLLPFTGMHHTMYSVELKNSKGELRTLHINSFGNIMRGARILENDMASGEGALD